MRRLIKIILGILGIFLFMAVVIISLGVRIVRRPLPKTAGKITVQGLQHPVKVYRDPFGVPHIFAQNDADLYFAAGYVVAQDRFWQMELNRRTATGTLSEVFGPQTLAIDQRIRTIGIPRISEALTKHISSTSREILEAYAAGVNAYLTQNEGKLPIEFSLLQYNSRPAPWKIEHSLAYQRLIAWVLELAWQVDPVMAAIAGRVPPEKFKEILPDYIIDVPVIVKNIDHLKVPLKPFRLRSSPHSMLFPFGAMPGIGSNSWVVAGQRSQSGKPLLANDPHLMHQAPAIWYEIHLNAPGIDCYGVTFPGVPGIVIGHNSAIAWGLTNAMADGCDFFIERINPTNPNQYWSGTTWNEMTTTVELIPIKDQPVDSFLVHSTQHGPIISSLHPAILGSGTAISMKWTGEIPSDEVLAFYHINRARNWDEFLIGLKYFTAPAQNFIYADTAGNIGYYCAGYIPLRPSGPGVLPQPAWTGNGNWLGAIPFEQLVHLFNPADGIIVTANNKVVGDNYPYYISSYWEPSYRANRIAQLLAMKDRHSVEDFKRIQSDQFCLHAQFLMPLIRAALPSIPIHDSFDQFAVQALQNWDLYSVAASPAAAIFETFLTRFYRNVYADELGDTLYQELAEFPGLLIRMTDHLIAKSSSSWFDNVQTPLVNETLSDIVQLSLAEAFGMMKITAGSILDHWRWGHLHTITFQHSLGKKSPLNRWFNIGPFPIGGAYSTINNATYSMRHPDFHVVAGPSMRQIVDLADRNRCLMVIPTGQSGHPFSRHYHDQSQLWLNNQYHPVMIDSSRIGQSSSDVLILTPY